MVNDVLTIKSREHHVYSLQQKRQVLLHCLTACLFRRLVESIILGLNISIILGFLFCAKTRILFDMLNIHSLP